MKIEIAHSKDSEDYIKEALLCYTEISDKIESVKGRALIHMYPYEDTMINGANNLNGFIDAYLCEVHVYDVVNKTVYKYKYSDEINFDVKCSTRIFKDLSTMIIIDEPIDIMYGSAIFVYKARESY